MKPGQKPALVVSSIPTYLGIRFTLTVWLRQGTSELSWFARLVILFLALTFAYLTSEHLLDLIEYLVPSSIENVLEQDTA